VLFLEKALKYIIRIAQLSAGCNMFGIRTDGRLPSILLVSAFIYFLTKMLNFLLLDQQEYLLIL
jgi:hypothetical protein